MKTLPADAENLKKSRESQVESPPQTLTNCHKQTVHCDAHILLTGAEQATFRGARFIDAETFLKHNPMAKLAETFVFGYYTYTQSPATVLQDVPAMWAANGWD